jgi:DNA-binding beta-propeller fold protein YncE
LLSGCTARWSSPDAPDAPELVWGRRGLAPGRFDRPRAAAIDAQDHIYVVDKTGRIQVFNTDGQWIRGWRTPETERGQPCGLAVDRDGNLLVADTHYYRMLVYTPRGQLLSSRTIGGVNGNGPGQFNFVTDAAQDSQGNYYIAEYGLFDRVQKLTREGEFLLQWGGHGDRPGQFIQPRGLVMDERDRLWVADACNHRIQVFDVAGEGVRLERIWGTQGTQPGQLRYPYGLALDGRGHVYISEFGNSRVQKFTLDGRYVASWGTAGRKPGELNQPWGVVHDSQGRLHVLDTYNHRVQRFRL